MSRGGRAMTRYFPEVLPAFRKLGPSKLVLDGELVVVGANGLDFGALQQRVHPAESRVRMLSEATPAWFVAFDLLAEGEEDLRKRPLGERRARLEKLLKGVKRRGDRMTTESVVMRASTVLPSAIVSFALPSSDFGERPNLSATSDVSVTRLAPESTIIGTITLPLSTNLSMNTADRPPPS